MINTKRVFYIYSYKRGVKGRNVGFAGIRGRDDNYKLNLSIKVPTEYGAEDMEICLLKRSQGFISGYKVGTMTPFNEICKFNTVISSKKLREAEFDINDIDGIYIFGAEQEEYSFFAKMDDELNSNTKEIFDCQMDKFNRNSQLVYVN